MADGYAIKSFALSIYHSLAALKKYNDPRRVFDETFRELISQNVCVHQ
jgi:hypothetical protein